MTKKVRILIIMALFLVVLVVAAYFVHGFLNGAGCIYRIYNAPFHRQGGQHVGIICSVWGWFPAAIARTE